MFQGRLLVGGQVLVDNALTYERMEKSGCPAGLFRQPECPTAIDLSGQVAPWNDPANPDLSERFHGFYVWDIRGLSDTFRSTQMIEGVTDGADIGRTRRTARTVRVTGSLFAQGRDALDYGNAWLSAVLDGDRCGQHGARCGVTDFEYLTECPPARGTVGEYTDWAESGRNYVKTPRMTTATNWVTTPLANTPGPSGIRLDRAAGAENATDIQALTFTSHQRAANTPYFGQIVVQVPTGYPAQLAKIELAADSIIYESVPVLVNPGESRTLTAYMPPGVGGTNILLLATVISPTPADTTKARRVILRNAIVQKAESGYFDGSMPATDLARYSWAGTADNSESIRETRAIVNRPRTDAEYAELIQPLRRFLHDVACTSGPIQTEKPSERDGWWRMDLEFTLTAGVPWVFSVTRVVELPITPTTVIQDTPYNLAPYPSAERSTGTVVVATNYSTNPSVETNATGWGAGTGGTSWTSANITQGRVTGELAAVGTSSFRSVLTVPTTGTAPTNTALLYNQQEIDLSARPANSRVSINMWSASLLAAGAPTREPLRFYAFWRATAGGAVIGGAVFLGTVPVDGGALSVSGLVPPAGANFVLVRAQVPLTSFTAGDVVRLYSDALAVTVP